MKHQMLGPPVGIRIAVGGGGGGYPVAMRGLLAGGPEGAAGRSLQAGGIGRWENPEGIGGNPRLTFLSTPVRIASATIDLGSAAAQRIDIIPDMNKVDIIEVSFGEFSAAPPSTMFGGIYASPPQGTGTSRINPPGAAIVDENAHYDGWAGGLTSYQPAVIRARRSPVALWWCPRLIDGVATPGPSGLTCVVEIIGIPTWA